MGNKTGIEWTDATWNPTVGCSIKSKGCTNCYAMKVAHRLGNALDQDKYRGLTRVVNGKPVWTGILRAVNGNVLRQPLRWAKPRRIFVNSMSDLFHEDLPDHEIDRVFAVMAMAMHHQFQVLTKRAERLQSYFAAGEQALQWRWLKAADEILGTAWGATLEGCFPLPNVWLGVSVEDQAAADERIPHLLATPAAKRFLSCEPLLGPVDLTQIDDGAQTFNALSLDGDNVEDDRDYLGACVDWVIVGGESGPGARPMHSDWARSLRDQCQAAGVPFFFKQWGEWGPLDGTGLASERLDADPKTDLYRIGKRRAGALLDGREWKEFPHD